MKKLSKIIIFALGIVFMMMIPIQSFAKLSNSGSVGIYGSGTNIIERASYYEPGGGKVGITYYLNFTKANSKSNFKFYVFDQSGNVIAEEEATKGSDETINVVSSGGSVYYNLKTPLPSGATVKVWGSDQVSTSKEKALADAEELTLAYSEEEPYSVRTKIDMKSGFSRYVGQNMVWGWTIYELNVTEDAMVNVTDFVASKDTSTYMFIVDELVPNQIPKSTDCLHTWKQNALIKSKEEMHFPLKKGTHYLVVDTDRGVNFSFNLELRKYVHPNVVWSASEGDINQAFDQNKTLHITVKITNKDSDARFPSDMTYSAPGTSGEPINVSADGMTGTFTFKTRNQAGVDEITIYIDELNPDTGGGSRPYSVDIMTGVSIKDIGLTTGPNYINIDTQKLPDYGSGSPATVIIYLKNGNNWVKKITSRPGGKGGTIKGLKPNKNYEIKLEMNKVLGNGKTATSASVFKVKTGPKVKPVIKSAKISKVKKRKVWLAGYWSGHVWHPGHYVTRTTYNLKITLKSKLKGCKGIVCSGVKVKGKGKVFKLTCTGNPVKKVSVIGYSNDTYMGYSNVSKAKKTSR